MLQEAASGEKISTLHKELEQLHASAAHMKVHLEAAQQSQTDAQVPAPCLAAASMLSARLQAPSRFPVALLFFADRHSISFCFCLSCCPSDAFCQSCERSASRQQHSMQFQSIPTWFRIL